MHLLVLNPNTSQEVSAALRSQIGAELAGSGAQLHTTTAALGARYIASEASYAIAGHATLDSWATHARQHGVPDAVLIGCFGDPGLFALREVSERPVVGLAEAAMHEAAALAGQERFAIVTGGSAWEPMLWRLARMLDLHERLACIRTVELTGPELAADRRAGEAALHAACLEALRESGVRAIVVGGAALGGFAARMAASLPVPLVDSVGAGARALLAAGEAAQGVQMSLMTGEAVDAGSDAGMWRGISPALRAYLPAA